MYKDYDSQYRTYIPCSRSFVYIIMSYYLLLFKTVGKCNALNIIIVRFEQNVRRNLTQKLCLGIVFPILKNVAI